MSGNVLVTITGQRCMGADDEDISLVIPGTCTEKNGTHTVRYEEPSEDGDGTILNRILIGNGCMQIRKQGLVNVQMNFLNRAGKSTSCYSTPYGDFLLGISTRDISVVETEERLRVDVSYAMDLGDEHFSDCRIRVEVTPRRK